MTADSDDILENSVQNLKKDESENVAFVTKHGKKFL